MQRTTHKNRAPFRVLLVGLITLLSNLFACSEDNPTVDQYCEDVSASICERLFDKECRDKELELDSVRYTSESECTAAERQVCEELKNNPSLIYNAGKARDCLDQISSKECQFAMQGNFFACTEVFTTIQPPITSLNGEGTGQ